MGSVPVHPGLGRLPQGRFLSRPGPDLAPSTPDPQPSTRNLLPTGYAPVVWGQPPHLTFEGCGARAEANTGQKFLAEEQISPSLPPALALGVFGSPSSARRGRGREGDPREREQRSPLASWEDALP